MYIKEWQERPPPTSIPFLAALADAIRPLADPVAIQAEATRLLGERLGASRALYGEIADGGDTVVIADDHYLDGAPSMVGRHRLKDFGPLLAEHLRAGRTFVLEDFEQVPGLTPSQRKAYAAIGLHAHVTVPLVKEGRFSAVLSVSQSSARRWTAEQVALVEATAERTWEAVERARTEQALRASEARYQSLFESIDEGFCVVEILLDDDGRPHDYRFLEANPMFERQTGLSGAVGRTARELVPDLETHWFEIYGRVALTGQSVRFVQGSEAMGRWFDVYAFRLGEPERRQVAILFTDVSERRRAEADRERLAAQRQLALDAARLGWRHYDPARRVVWWDDRYQSIHGLVEAGDRIEGVLGRLHPDDLLAVRAAIEAAIDPEDPKPFSTARRRRGGPRERRAVPQPGRRRAGDPLAHRAGRLLHLPLPRLVRADRPDRGRVARLRLVRCDPSRGPAPHRGDLPAGERAAGAVRRRLPAAARRRRVPLGR